MTDGTYVIITPARNEARYLRRTIVSVAAQTHRPAEWLIVDDGSSDDTAEIAHIAAAEHPWIRVIRMSDRGLRVVGAGVVEAFEAGLAARWHPATDFICKLDADIDLPPRYFETIVSYFQSDPTLGIASGSIVESVGDRLVELRHEPEMAFGAAKFWRRTCFEAIGGLERSVGWDGIDVYQAMRRGWRTMVLSDPALRMLHLRRMGTSHKSILHGCSRRGRALWYNRAHPVWVVGSAAYRTLDRPYGVAGLCVLFGYLAAACRRAPRINDREFGIFLRQWQMRKLRNAVWH
jgi:glycosyltransferase involved in cell wall biosynthesis